MWLAVPETVSRKLPVPSGGVPGPVTKPVVYEPV